MLTQFLLKLFRVRKMHKNWEKTWRGPLTMEEEVTHYIKATNAHTHKKEIKKDGKKFLK